MPAPDDGNFNLFFDFFRREILFQRGPDALPGDEFPGTVTAIDPVGQECPWAT